MRSQNGSQLVELPGALLLLFIGLAFPVIIYATIFYRTYVFDSMIQNACLQGANQTSLAQAQTAVSNYLSAQSVNGITLGAPNVKVLTEAVSYTNANGPQSYNAYYLQVIAPGNISPLMQFKSWFGLSIPGLTGPVNLTTTTQAYFENQQALSGS